MKDKNSNTLSEEPCDKDTTNIKKKHRWLWVILIAVLLLLFMGIFFVRCSDAKKGHIDYTNKESVQDDLNRRAKESNFIVFANTNIQVDTKGTANIMVQNDKKNKRNCKVDVYIEDELCYSSEVLKPEEYLDTVKVDTKDIEEGEYKGKTVFHVLNKHGEVVSNMTVNTDVTVD